MRIQAYAEFGTAARGGFGTNAPWWLPYLDVHSILDFLWQELNYRRLHATANPLVSFYELFSLNFPALYDRYLSGEALTMEPHQSYGSYVCQYVKHLSTFTPSLLCWVIMEVGLAYSLHCECEEVASRYCLSKR